MTEQTENRHSAMWRPMRLVALAAMLLITATGTGVAQASTVASSAVGGEGRLVDERQRLVPPGTGSPLVERLRAAVDRPAAGARAASVTATAVELPSPCWLNVIIQSPVNNRLVAAEYGFYDNDTGMLRARTYVNVGPWERFTVCRNPQNWRTIIQSEDYSHPYVVAAEVAEPGTRRGLLRARTDFDFIGEWEIFTTYLPPNNRHNATWFYSPSAGKYVSAQFDYPGNEYASLRARLGTVGPWETFYW